MSRRPRWTWFAGRFRSSIWIARRGRISPRWGGSSARSCRRVSYSMPARLSMNELRIVEAIAKMATGGRGIVMGIGDDCAIYRPKPGEDLLFTTDQCIEGVHFNPGLAAPVIGERALARSGRDIAAMGG